MTEKEDFYRFARLIKNHHLSARTHSPSLPLVQVEGLNRKAEYITEHINSQPSVRKYQWLFYHIPTANMFAVAMVLMSTMENI